MRVTAVALSIVESFPRHPPNGRNSSKIVFSPTTGNVEVGFTLTVAMISRPLVVGRLTPYLQAMASTGSISNPVNTPNSVNTNRWRPIWPKLSGYRIIALTSALAFGTSKYLISDKMGKIVDFSFVFWSMLCVPCLIWSVWRACSRSNSLTWLGFVEGAVGSRNAEWLFDRDYGGHIGRGLVFIGECSAPPMQPSYTIEYPYVASEIRHLHFSQRYRANNAQYAKSHASVRYWHTLLGDQELHCFWNSPRVISHNHKYPQFHGVCCGI